MDHGRLMGALPCLPLYTAPCIAVAGISGRSLP